MKKKNSDVAFGRPLFFMVAPPRSRSGTAALHLVQALVVIPLEISHNNFSFLKSMPVETI